jgi:hypothetical protein
VMGRPSDQGTIKVRASLRYRLFVLSPLLVLLPASLLTGSFFIHQLTWTWFFYSVAASVIGSWFGINLTSSEAVVHNIRRRRIPWSAVQSITREPFMGGHRVVLWMVDRQPVPLRAPVVDFTGVGARAFETRFHVIGQWWLAHRESP